MTDIYLDVDGVLNAVALSTPKHWGWTEDRVVRVNGFQIRYAPELIARLNRLAERSDVDFHWLTTWEDDAATLLGPAIGLNGAHWPVLGTQQHYSKELSGGWWKHHALTDYFPTRDRRAVWIDDDYNYDTAAREWVATLGGTLRAFSPACEVGLTRDDMDAIEAWIDADPTDLITLARCDWCAEQVPADELTDGRECGQAHCAGHRCLPCARDKAADR